MPSYFHYTCEHRAPGIRDDGLVYPGHKQTHGANADILGIPWAAYAWFTDLAVPAREPLGLTNEILVCDRTAFRFRAIDGARLVPWISIRRNHPWAGYLETGGARPAHWYVSVDPVPVIEAPRNG
jgi:hypothetical protein